MLSLARQISGTCRAKVTRKMHVRGTQKTEFQGKQTFLLYMELFKPRSWYEREGLIRFIAVVTTYLYLY